MLKKTKKILTFTHQHVDVLTRDYSEVVTSLLLIVGPQTSSNFSFYDNHTPEEFPDCISHGCDDVTATKSDITPDKILKITVGSCYKMCLLDHVLP